MPDKVKILYVANFSYKYFGNALNMLYFINSICWREEEIFEQHQEIQKSIQKKITEFEMEEENQLNVNR